MSVAHPPVPDRSAPSDASGGAADPGVALAIDACLRRLDEAIAAAGALGIPTDQAEEVRRDVAGRLGFPADSYVLALVGGTGVGKSSLLNALAGTRVSDASVRRPTTDRPIAWIPEGRGGPLDELLAWLGVAGGDVHRHPGGRLGDAAVLDLPDLDSTATAHRERVEAILPRVDSVAWVTDPEKYHDAVLHDDFLATWLPRLDRQVVILNKTDRLSPDDAERVRRDLEHDLAKLAGGDREAPRVRVLLSTATGDGTSGVDAVADWLAGAVEAKRIVRARLLATIQATVAALTRAAGVDPAGRARAFVGGSARRTAIDGVTVEVLRVVDLPGVEARAVAATRARARARGAGPVGAITSRIYRLSGREARVADPGPYVRRWRERGSLAPALDILRATVAAPLSEAPPVLRPRLATSVEPAALEASLATAVDRAIAARPFEAPTSRWWTVIGLLQTIATLGLVFAATWVILWVIVKFPVDSVAVPVLGRLPMPFVLLVAALLVGYLLARLLGAHAGRVGRKWARTVRSQIRKDVGTAVEASAFARLDQLEIARRSLWNAARDAGGDCAIGREGRPSD